MIKVLRELKKDHPHVEISKHCALATDSNFDFTDRELFLALQKHKNELEMNTLSDKDLQRVIDETDELFKEIEEEDEWSDEDQVY